MAHTTATSPQLSPTPKGGFRQSDRAAIPEEALSFRERKVLSVLCGAAEPQGVRELARKCFPGLRSKPNRYERPRADGTTVREGTGAAYRCVLNSLRRLVAGGFARKVARGTYAATANRAGS